MSAPAAGPAVDASSCFDNGFGDCQDSGLARSLRIAAVLIILCSSSIGVAIPYVVGRFTPFNEHRPVFFALKAFGAGVILSTGLIHILPGAEQNLSDPCLGWFDYPWGTMIATFAAITVQLLEFTMGKVLEGRLVRRIAKDAPKPKGAVTADDAEVGAADTAAGDLQPAYVHGHAHGLSAGQDVAVRRLTIAQVLEAGIAVHSVLIGIDLGVSNSPCTMRPLLIALTFHQMFEGCALGACLLQVWNNLMACMVCSAAFPASKASFAGWGYLAMAAVFALTTPVGVIIGIGVSSTYNAKSVYGLAVPGIFDSMAAGILIYMALVDIIASDFLSKAFRSSARLQITGYLALFAGAAFMAVLAIWA